MFPKAAPIELPKAKPCPRRPKAEGICGNDGGADDGEPRSHIVSSSPACDADSELLALPGGVARNGLPIDTES